MADITAAAAPLLRAPRRWRIAAAALRVLLAVSAYVAVSGLLSALWMGSAASAARIAARRAYHGGEGSRAAVVAGAFRGVAFLAVGLFLLAFCLTVLVDMVLRRPRASRNRKTAAEADREAESTRARRGVVNGRVARPVIAVLFVVMAVGLLVVLEQAKGSFERVGSSMLLDTVSFIISLTFCLVIVPNYAIRVSGGAKGLRNVGIMTRVSFKALEYAILGCRGDFTWPSGMMR